MSALKKFEVAVFNQEVRDCVKLAERHRKYDDSWENIHYIEILARSFEEARRAAAKRFPPSDGFVIDLIEEMKEFY